MTFFPINRRSQDGLRIGMKVGILIQYRFKTHCEVLSFFSDRMHTSGLLILNEEPCTAVSSIGSDNKIINLKTSNMQVSNDS